MPSPSIQRDLLIALAPFAVVLALAAAAAMRSMNGGGRTIVRYNSKLVYAGGDTLTMFTAPAQERPPALRSDPCVVAESGGDLVQRPRLARPGLRDPEYLRRKILTCMLSEI